MKIRLELATPADVPALLALRAAVAENLTRPHGSGPWSRASTERGVLFEMRMSKVFVARRREKIVASLLLATKKPWAIDPQYFQKARRPLYLMAMAVAPTWQGKGIGRACLAAVEEIGRRWPADAIWLDAYDAPAGAGAFYAKCGFTEVGRKTYRGCPLVYFERRLAPTGDG